MILIFDLDDTLYPECSYVDSGLTAVSEYLTHRFGLEVLSTKNTLSQILSTDGRGQVFNTFLRSVDLYNKKNVRECLSAYRTHRPSISLFSETLSVLNALSQYPHYVVTDGNKVVQYNKVLALGIEPLFKKVFITHRYGKQHAKPSPYCFNLIRQREKVNWSDIVYVGDNPNKDFVNLNGLGATTIRVLTGMFRGVVADKQFDAKYTIEHIRTLPKLIDGITAEHRLSTSQPSSPNSTSTRTLYSSRNITTT